MIEYEISRLKEYLEVLAAHLVDTRNRWEKRVEQQAQTIEDPEVRNEYLESFSDEYWEYKEHERLLCNSCQWSR